MRHEIDIEGRFVTHTHTLVSCTPGYTHTHTHTYTHTHSFLARQATNTLFFHRLPTRHTQGVKGPEPGQSNASALTYLAHTRRRLTKIS